MRNLFRQSSRRQKHRLPSALSAEIQLLEQRTLPAGTVTAVVSGGNLTLTGDNRSNQVTINVTATGLTVMGTDGTRIARGARSSSTQVFTGNNNFSDVTINLNNGDDSLTVNVGTGLAAGNLVAQRNLKINTGTGNDSVTVNNASLTSGAILVRGDLTVSLGAGNNSLRTSTPPETDPPSDPPITLVRTPISVTGNVKITGDIGDDIVDLEALTVGRHLTIETGSGNDQVALTDSTVTGNATVALAAGDDGLVTDGLLVSGDAKFDTGTGNDGASIVDSTFARLTKFQLQSGDDELFLSSEFESFVDVDGGSGNDILGIGSSFFQKSVTFDLRDGNDQVFIDDAEFVGPARFDLGEGDDFLGFGFVPEVGEPVTPIFRATSRFIMGGGDDFLGLESANFQGNSLLDLGSGNDQLGVAGGPLTKGENVVISVVAGDGTDTLVYEIAQLIALDLEALADEDNTVFEVKTDIGTPVIP